MPGLSWRFGAGGATSAGTYAAAPLTVTSRGAAVFGAEPATDFGADCARIMAGLGRETFTFDAEGCLTPPTSRTSIERRVGGLGPSIWAAVAERLPAVGVKVHNLANRS
jgi:hypothetical protein